MEIIVKSVKLTKSKILQMDYIITYRSTDVDVLGWVNIDKKKWVIIKKNNCYYRTDLITKIEKEEKGTQFSLPTGGYEFPILNHIKISTHNGGQYNYTPERDDNKNIEMYDHLISFKRKTEIAGQIYY